MSNPLKLKYKAPTEQKRKRNPLELKYKAPPKQKKIMDLFNIPTTILYGSASLDFQLEHFGPPTWQVETLSTSNVKQTLSNRPYNYFDKYLSNFWLFK